MFLVRLWLAVAVLLSGPLCARAAEAALPSRLQKRWLFVWRDMSDPREVERMIARFPEAGTDGYNGVVFSCNVAPSMADELKQAATANGLELIAVVMGGAHDRNYVEGVPVKDAVFIVRGSHAVLQPDETARVLNGGFEQANESQFTDWTLQDDAGITTFADHDVVHSGTASLRMENIGRNPCQHCRVAQAIRLKPFRQYHISFWAKTRNLSPADAEVKLLSADASSSISFETFHVDATQDWKHYDLVFNSLDHNMGRLYLGCWAGKSGLLWWDDVQIEEIALVNLLRRPGCPLTVEGEDGTKYEEGRDYYRVIDRLLNPWQPYHQPPLLTLTSSSRIHQKERLRVSYYHPLIAYEDRVNYCLSEPKVFNNWEAEVKQANDLFHPEAYLMSHDEIRVMNQCALCQSKHMTAGELLAWNVHRAAGIIRKIRPDAEIWVWSDMFDPMHNAVDHYFAVKGTLAGSWKGLDKDIGIVNWNGAAQGKNCAFFAALGLRQILSGYYDSDDDGAGIAQWLANTRGVPGIAGVMYTTWQDKYGAMREWGEKAWGK